MKSLFVAAAVFLGTAARADVRYAFSSVFGSFVLVTSQPLRRDATFPGNRLIRPKGFLNTQLASVSFQSRSGASDNLLVRLSNGRTLTFVFPKGAFAAYGTKKTSAGIRGQLSASKMPAAKSKKP